MGMRDTRGCAHPVMLFRKVGQSVETKINEEI